jgi:transposase
MKRFVEGEDRRQGVLLPEYLDDYVSEDNPVRVIDVFVDELDLGVLAFAGVVPEATGRPRSVKKLNQLRNQSLGLVGSSS